MEGTNCGKVIRGRKELWALAWGGSPDPGGREGEQERRRRERKCRGGKGKEREKKPVQGTAQENYSSKPLTRKKERITVQPVL